MNNLTRRAALAGLAAAPLARPGIIRAQSTSKPVRILMISDLNGPYRDVGGPGQKVGCDLAVEDFGGSVLDRKIEVIQVDGQNKPNIAGALAREWIDAHGANVLTDGAATSSGLAMQTISKERKVIYLITGPASTNFTQKLCTPYGFHWTYDTYAMAKGTGGKLTQAGGDTWFFITADYAFGTSLQTNTEEFVKKAGGKILGSVRAPLGTADFSSYLVQARASGAKVIGFANAGDDLVNCLKQASEFGIAKGGQKMATLLMFITNVAAVGQDICEGLVLTNSFYWNLNDKTRAWTKRYVAKMNSPPTMLHAGQYSATLAWLKAVKAAGTVDGDAVSAKLHATPVNDFYDDNVAIQPNGRVAEKMYVWQVKPASESKEKWDFYKPIGTMSGEESTMPMAETGCPLVHA